MSLTILQTRNQIHRLKDFPKVRLRMIKVELKLRVLHMVRIINTFSVRVHVKHYTEHRLLTEWSQWRENYKRLFTDIWEKSKNISTFVFQHLSNKVNRTTWYYNFLNYHLYFFFGCLFEQSVCVIFSQIILLFGWLFCIGCVCGKGRMVGEV